MCESSEQEGYKVPDNYKVQVNYKAHYRIEEKSKYRLEFKN